MQGKVGSLFYGIIALDIYTRSILVTHRVRNGHAKQTFLSSSSPFFALANYFVLLSSSKMIFQTQKMCSPSRKVHTMYVLIQSLFVGAFAAVPAAAAAASAALPYCNRFAFESFEHKSQGRRARISLKRSLLMQNAFKGQGS